MRYRAILSAAVAALLLMASAIPVAAKGPIEIVTFSDQFTDVNPCTGAEVEVFGEATLRIHEFQLTSPERHHFNIQFTFELTTSDGFAGRVVGPDVHNATGLLGAQEEEQAMFKAIANGVLRNPETNQKFRVHLNVTLIWVHGELHVDRDEGFLVTCIGPAA